MYSLRGKSNYGHVDWQSRQCETAVHVPRDTRQQTNSRENRCHQRSLRSSATQPRDRIGPVAAVPGAAACRPIPHCAGRQFYLTVSTRPSSRSKKPKATSRKLTHQISDTTRAGKRARTTTTSIDIVLITCPNELHRAFLAKVTEAGNQRFLNEVGGVPHGAHQTNRQVKRTVVRKNRVPYGGNALSPIDAGIQPLDLISKPLDLEGETVVAEFRRHSRL
jgi:hypothetical protein